MSVFLGSSVPFIRLGQLVSFHFFFFGGGFWVLVSHFVSLSVVLGSRVIVPSLSVVLGSSVPVCPSRPFCQFSGFPGF